MEITFSSIQLRHLRKPGYRRPHTSHLPHRLACFGMAPICPAPHKALFFRAGMQPAPLRGARPGIRCGLYLKESPVFQYGVRGLLLCLPHVKFYVYFYFPLHQRPHLFADPHDGWCGEERLNTVPYPIWQSPNYCFLSLTPQSRRGLAQAITVQGALKGRHNVGSKTF